MAQAVKRYNVCSVKAYTTPQGETKTKWVKLGHAVMFDNYNLIIEMDSLPLNQDWDGRLSLFVQDDRNEDLPQHG